MIALFRLIRLSHMNVTQQTDLLSSIPDPETIRDMIHDRIREASLLRGLLKVAERQHRKCPDGRRASKRREVRRAD